MLSHQHRHPVCLDLVMCAFSYMCGGGGGPACVSLTGGLRAAAIPFLAVDSHCPLPTIELPDGVPPFGGGDPSPRPRSPSTGDRAVG